MDGKLKTVIITAAITLVAAAGIAVGVYFLIVLPGVNERLHSFRARVDELGERNQQLKIVNDELTNSNKESRKLITELEDGARKQQVTIGEIQSGIGSSANLVDTIRSRGIWSCVRTGDSIDS